MFLFNEFPKVPRYSRDCVITEKIDGTNAQIRIEMVVERGYVARVGLTNVAEIGDYFFMVGSRSRHITPDDDNYGFARWAYAHADELIAGLGVGIHYGEWWGSGIQCGYGLTGGDKRFSLFNVERWGETRNKVKYPLDRPACCGVVPVLYQGPFGDQPITDAIARLTNEGSLAAPGYRNPEGIMIYHVAANAYFKKTIHKDESPKGKSNV